MTFLGRYFHAFEKRRAIRSYARRLPRLLARDYGFSRSYNAEQVRRTIERSRLNIDYSCYAIAMFSDRDSFDAFHLGTGEVCEYSVMRMEIADRYFGGDTDFSIVDITAISSEAAGETGHNGGHAMSGGGAHDGHGHH